MVTPRAVYTATDAPLPDHISRRPAMKKKDARIDPSPMKTGYCNIRADDDRAMSRRR
jgi:hypothetical protein